MYRNWIHSLFSRSAKQQLLIGRKRLSRQRPVSKYAHFETLENRSLMASDTDAGSGLLAQYFGDANLVQFAGASLVSQLDSQWGSRAPTVGSPPVQLNGDNFSVRWSGQIEAKFTEEHQFIVNAEGGIRLWVNGTLLVNRWIANQVTESSATINLIAGRRYDIQLEFRETVGNASVRIDWASPSMARTAIPRSQLFASQRGTIMLEQWNATPGSASVNLSQSSEFNTSPLSVTSATQFEPTSNTGNNYLRRMRGWLYPPETGTYRFYIASDEKAELWLSNSDDPADKQKIAFVNAPTGIRNWVANPSQQSVELALVAGQHYYIETIQRENFGTDYLAIGWTKPDSALIEIIPGEALSPVVPRVEIAAIQPTIAEGASTPAKFTVFRSEAPLTNSLTIAYRTRGTISGGIDTSTLNGSVTIPAGQVSADIDISALADSLIEGTEQLIIELVDGTGYEVGLISQRTARLTIQDVRPAPNNGISLLAGNRLTNFTNQFGASFTEIADTSPGSTSGMMIQATILSQPTAAYDVQLIQTNATSIAAGDLLWAEFYIRSTTSSGLAQIVHEDKQAPFLKSLNKGIPLSITWTKVQIPFTAVRSYAPDEANFSFQLGSQVQTVQIAQVRLVNLGQSKDLMPTSGMALNNIDGTWGINSIVSVSGQTFRKADQIQTFVSPPINESYRLQGLVRNAAAIQSGDTLALEFYARATSGALPRLHLALQRTDTYAALIDQPITITSQWTKFNYSVAVDSSFDIEGLQVAFFAGFETQTIQIGGLKWTNLNASYELSDLPSIGPIVTYGGRDPIADWRRSADQRIDQHRQASLTINVVDVNGLPVDGALVHVKQTSHQFKFGTAITNANGLLDTPTQSYSASSYQSLIKRLFNSVVIENELKWPLFVENPQAGIDAVQWSQENDLYLRGHNLIWPSRQNMPASVWQEYDQLLATEGSLIASNYLRQSILDHITDIVLQFNNIVGEWDVVNEPFANKDVMDILGDSILLDWFQKVGELSPGTKRVLNDYEIFANNGNNLLHRTNFDNWLTQLTSQNLIEIIGEQSHFNEGNLTDINTLGSLINSYYSQFDTSIAITELDIDSQDVQLQADYFRDYLTQAFSQQGVSEIMLWGFWSQAHWIPQAALYEADFSIKPNGQVYEDLVFGEWWTDTRATTRNGQITTNATFGDYEIEISFEGQRFTTTISNLSGNALNQVQLPGIQIPVNTIQSSEGSVVSYPVVLNSKPSANVTVTVAGDPLQIQITNPRITFTPQNWNIPVQVIVRVKEDYLLEGIQTTLLTHVSASKDPNFDLLKLPTVEVQFTDGITPSITLSSNTVATLAAIGTAIGSLAVPNAVPSETYSFSLTAGAGDTDNGSFAIVGNQIVTAALLSTQSKSTFSILVRATDRYGVSFVRVLSININSNPIMIGSVRIGNGSPQRSMVDRLTIEFSTAVVLTDSTAFTIYKRTLDANNVLTLVPVTTTITSTVLSNGYTRIVISFASMTRPGTPALEDGNYQLDIDGSKIKTEGTSIFFDGDSNPNTIGGTLQFGTLATDRFFSQFGNISADRLVNAADYVVFMQAFNKQLGQGGYTPVFDINRDQKVDLIDRAAFLDNFEVAFPFI